MYGMLLLVDGYNVTMRDTATSSKSKEEQRNRLLERLRVHATTLVGRGSVVVVFDARAELGHVSGETGVVREVFARDADDEIVRRCSSARGEVSVVTDDMRLRARISQDIGRHVKFRNAEELFEGVLGTRAKGSRATPLARDAGLPEGANKITEELKKLWLSEEDE